MKKPIGWVIIICVFFALNAEAMKKTETGKKVTAPIRKNIDKLREGLFPTVKSSKIFIVRKFRNKTVKKQWVEIREKGIYIWDRFDSMEFSDENAMKLRDILNNLYKPALKEYEPTAEEMFNEFWKQFNEKEKKEWLDKMSEGL